MRDRPATFEDFHQDVRGRAHPPREGGVWVLLVYRYVFFHGCTPVLTVKCQPRCPSDWSHELVVGTKTCSDVNVPCQG